MAPPAPAADFSRIAGPARLAMAMVAVCLAYYAGSLVGLALRIPPATTSVMWPPNTILTLALMLTPPRRWAWILAAALSAHFAVQGGTGWPPLLIVGFFATNSLEAILGAAAFRWLAGARPRIDSLRHMTLFIGVVAVVAPLLSSFPDAAAVNWLQGEPFFLVLRRRVASNVMTTLVLLPALLVLCLHLRRWIRGFRPRRWLEAGALTLALVATAQFAVSPLSVHVGGLPVTLTPLVVVLPFLLWAAVRFGTAGASLSLFVTASSAVQSAITHAAYADLAAAEASVLTLQTSLIMLAIPLLCVAALVEERYRARVEMAGRLAFEAVLARVSASFVYVPTPEIPRALEASLESLGRFIGLDGLVLLECPTGGGCAQTVANWTVLERARPLLLSLGQACPWTIGQLLAERSVTVTSLAELPVEAVVDRQALEAAAVRAVLAMPMVVGGRTIGGLVCLAMTGDLPRGQDVIDRLRQAAEVFGNALARKQADSALRESEAMKSGILIALPNAVAVFDRHGEIVTFNQQWQRVGADPSLAILAGPTSGSYAAHCRAVEQAGVSQAREVMEGVDVVLAGQSPAVTVEYCARPIEVDRWFSVTVVPLGGAEGGAVATHTEITERRRAQRSAQRAREELAHVTRVAAMSELAASLAHQVSQPLAGILRNAEAAQQMVAASDVDMEAIASRLGAIVEDDHRVSDVIQRLRELLRRGPDEQAQVDVNAVVQDVVHLVQADAEVRNIHLTAHLASTPLLVRGDRVQLAQALLNLIANATDAVATSEPSQRRVTVITEEAYEAALVVVRDTGPGLGHPPDVLFEPFFTTKPSGIGMGLPIARTIIESHGGRVWAADDPGGVGASAFVSVPLDTQAP